MSFLNDIVFEATADQTLDGVKSVFRVGHGLALGGLAYQGFAVVGVGNDGRRGTTARCLMTLALSPSSTATQELVVPRSIPIMRPIAKTSNSVETKLMFYAAVTYLASAGFPAGCPLFGGRLPHFKGFLRQCVNAA